MSAAKISVAKKAVKYIESKISKETVLGIGTGSTVNFFIEELGNLKPVSYTHLTLPTMS